MGNDKKHTMDAILQEKKREMQLDQAFELSNSASFTDCTGSVCIHMVFKAGVGAKGD